MKIHMSSLRKAVVQISNNVYENPILEFLNFEAICCQAINHLTAKFLIFDQLYFLSTLIVSLLV